MSINDITFLYESGAVDVPSQRWQAQAGTTVINPGEPVRFASSGSRYAVALGDAEPVIDVTPGMLGIASGASTQTGGVDGIVDVHDLVPGITYLCEALSAAAVDTLAEYKALEGKRVVFDLTGGKYTVDTAVGDSAANGLIIMPLRDNTKAPYVGKVAFKVRSQASYLDGCCPS